MDYLSNNGVKVAKISWIILLFFWIIYFITTMIDVRFSIMFRIILICLLLLTSAFSIFVIVYSGVQWARRKNDYKGLLYNFLTLILAVLIYSSFTSVTQNSAQGEYVPGELIIEFNPETTQEQIDLLFEEFNLTTKYEYDIIYAYAVKLPENLSVEEAIPLIKQNSIVLGADPNYIYQVE